MLVTVRTSDENVPGEGTASVVATFTATIASGQYPLSRSLYIYVKKAHIGVVPGLKEYVEFFSSEKMIGPDGPLAEYGLDGAHHPREIAPPAPPRDGIVDQQAAPSASRATSAVPRPACGRCDPSPPRPAALPLPP